MLSSAVERGLIDGGGQAAAGSVRGLGVLVQRVQSGNIRSYAGWLTIGAAALLALAYFGFHAIMTLVLTIRYDAYDLYPRRRGCGRGAAPPAGPRHPVVHARGHTRRLRLSLHLPAHYLYGRPGFQYEVNRPWISSLNIHYHVGVDGISLWLVVLSAFLAVLGVLASWNAIADRTKEFYFFFLLQQTAMIGVFVALDIFLYYAFWEFTLVPMAILIAMFGRDRGTQAALKFFLYTFLPSALFLAAILWLYAKTGTFDFVQLQTILAHGNSPLLAPGALLDFTRLSGCLRREGSCLSAARLAERHLQRSAHGDGHGRRRQARPLLHPAFQSRPLSRAGAAGCAVDDRSGRRSASSMERCSRSSQKDLKRLVAYGTLSSLSFCILGIFSFSIASVDGAVFQTINEGIIGGGLLVLLGFLYERYGTFEIDSLWRTCRTHAQPRHSCSSSARSALIGLPLLSGFVGEFLILSGSFSAHAGWVAAATVGVILSAAYMLGAIQRIFYGSKSTLVIERSAPRHGLP